MSCSGRRGIAPVLSLMAVAICMRWLPYYGEILLITWILAIVAFALFMRHRKDVHSIGHFAVYFIYRFLMNVHILFHTLLSLLLYFNV